MSVDRATVDHLAGLAKLRLDDDERESLAAQLATIVEYVAQLETVDVADVPPTASPGRGAEADAREGPSTRPEEGAGNRSGPRDDDSLRDDEPAPCLSQEVALSNAPDADEGHFLVPRVLPDE